MDRTVKVIARMESAFPEKFGIPRQSGLVEQLKSRIVFEPEYRNPDALRGLEEFSHLWIIWEFSQAVREGWSATVRPPRLGGKCAKGRFCHPLPFSAQSSGPLLRKNRGDRADGGAGAGDLCAGSGSDGRNAYL